MTSPPDHTDPGLYARSFADVYDDWYANLHDIATIVTAITARTGPDATIVELGSGSGRLAGPLSDQHRVIALDAALSMLDQDLVSPARVAADMALLPLANTSVDAAIIAYNTFFNLVDPGQQGRCLDEAARVLRPGGWLAVETFVAPDADPGQPFGLSVVPHHTDPDARMAIATWHDPDNPEQITGAHIELSPHGVRSRPWLLTYRAPTAIDQMAADRGFELVERFSDWAGHSVTPDTPRQIAWYRHP